jgi:UDP-N-acetylglucosamine 2-epimerase (non-hydrolysing)
MKKLILAIIGTRPEAIKLCPLVRELRTRPAEFETVVCTTGQHREMLDQVLRTFDVRAHCDLQLMSRNQSLAQFTAKAVAGLDDVFDRFKPDVCVVQGDTTTALCGALVGHYHHVPIAHVEAGLRTRNKYAPFPEEMNRQLVGRLADLHFAPTIDARNSLLMEGVDPATVFVTGNTVIDALLWIRDRVVQNIPESAVPIADAVHDRQVVLITGHRRESFGDGFENICNAIRDVADQQPQVAFVYPVHLNPNVQQPVNRILGGHPRIHLIAPLSYEPFVWLMNRAAVVLTDSGGVQEEAPSLGKPVLVMRTTTERPEGVRSGNARLVGVSRERIARELTLLLNDPQQREQMAQVQNPYGDGTACRQIADLLTRQIV